MLRLTTFNLAIGNSDAHAKNISVLRYAEGAVALAPAYDVAMHAYHRSFSDRFALDVLGINRMSVITGPDLVAEGASWPLPLARARRAVAETLEQLDQAIDRVDHSRHLRVSDVAWTTVRERTTVLLRSLS